jgi:hypothetical protein
VSHRVSTVCDGVNRLENERECKCRTSRVHSVHVKEKLSLSVTATMNRDPTNTTHDFLDCPRFRSEEDHDAYVESIQPHRELICPITQELMRDPVVAEDGYTYEREAILRWFSVGR